MEIYELRVYARDGGGNFFQNVLHYLVTEETPAVSPFKNAEDLLDAWNTAVTTAWVACYASDGVLDAISSRKVTPGSGGTSAVKPIFSFGTLTNATGTGCPAFNLRLITAHTPVREGHIYMGATTFDSWEEDLPTNIILTPMTALRTVLLNQISFGTAGTADLAVFSRKDGAAYEVQDIGFPLRVAQLPRRTRPFG